LRDQPWWSLGFGDIERLERAMRERVREKREKERKEKREAVVQREKERDKLG
jgi:hypothetical protein